MPNKTEYPEIQAKIMQHLFDQARTITFDDIMTLIKKPESEAKYHCEQLATKKLIQYQSVGRDHTDAYVITDVGRKWIMER